MLPDEDGVIPAARLLQRSSGIIVRHGSGQPWLLGSGIANALRVFTIGHSRVAVIGACLASDQELRECSARAVRTEEFDPLLAFPGSFHLCVTSPIGLMAYGDVTGLRRIFATDFQRIPAVASHSDLLRRLVGAPVNRTWLAGRLASPEMPSPLRETMSPFEGIVAIPPGHRLIVRNGSIRHAPYWTPRSRRVPFPEGVAAFREAVARAVSGRIGAAGDGVSIQLSGGLDSAALSCLAGEAIRDRSALLLVTTASISPGNDDVSWARLTAEHLAPAEHLVVGAQEAPRFFDHLTEAAPSTDEPATFVPAGARVRHLAQMLVINGTGLHLNGQGGDEVVLAPLTYLHDAFRAHPRTGWQHMRGQGALHDMRPLRLAWRALAEAPHDRWLRSAARTLRREASKEVVALGWEAQPLLPPWVSRDAEEILRGAILQATPASGIERTAHASLTRIRSTAYRAAMYGEALASAGVPVEFPFFDRGVVEAALAVAPWERTNPWEPKPLLRAAMADVVPAPILARRTKANYNDDLYEGWRINRHKVAELLDDFRLSQLGLVDVAPLRECLRSFGRPGLDPVLVTDTIACEVWLRSLAPPFVHDQEVGIGSAREFIPS